MFHIPASERPKNKGPAADGARFLPEFWSAGEGAGSSRLTNSIRAALKGFPEALGNLSRSEFTNEHLEKQ